MKKKKVTSFCLCFSLADYHELERKAWNGKLHRTKTMDITIHITLKTNKFLYISLLISFIFTCFAYGTVNSCINLDFSSKISIVYVFEEVICPKTTMLLCKLDFIFWFQRYTRNIFLWIICNVDYEKSWVFFSHKQREKKLSARVKRYYSWNEKKNIL